jgi:predicted deacylase
VKPGDVVTSGQLLGEIVDIVNPDAPRTPIVSRTAGIVFGMRSHKLSRPGDVVVKVAGREALEWRKGNLLTSR